MKSHSTRPQCKRRKPVKRLPGKRPGAVGPLTALMLIPMVALVAFAVDIGWIVKCQAELQNAADAAALAGALQLATPVTNAVTAKTVADKDDTTVSAATIQGFRTTAETNGKSAAQTYVAKHKGGNVSLVLNTSDITVGYIANYKTAPSTSTGQLSTSFDDNMDDADGTPSMPNSVKVLVRRDSTVSTGALNLFFGPVFSLQTANVAATATATLNYSQGPPTFSQPGGGLLPIAMRLEVYNLLIGAKDDIADQPTEDKYTIDLALPPPDPRTTPATGSSVAPGADGKVEVTVYPEKSGSGNFGLVNLKNDKTSNAKEIGDWIDNGLSQTDLDSWPGKKITASFDSPLTMDGQTGIEASQEDNLKAIIGEPRIMPVFKDDPVGKGTNLKYQVVGFVTIVITEVNLPKHLKVQVSRTIRSDIDVATTGGGGSSTPASFVISGVSLSR